MIGVLYLLLCMIAGFAPLAFEAAAMDSYNCRVEEYSDPKTGLYYWGGTTERWT